MELKYEVTAHGNTEVQISQNCKTKSKFKLLYTLWPLNPYIVCIDLSIFCSALKFNTFLQTCQSLLIAIGIHTETGTEEFQ